MEQDNLKSTVGLKNYPAVSDSFKVAWGNYKENFSFIGFVYLPIAVLSVLGVFLPGIIGGAFLFISSLLGVFVTPGFISAVNKNFYPDVPLPLEKLKLLYSDGAKYILPVFWIGILVALCVFFGLTMLVIPGIWLSVILGYSIYALIFDGKRGVEAVAYSYIYAKNSFWFIFKRMLVLWVGLAIVGSIISGFFPPTKTPISEMVGGDYSNSASELKNNPYFQKLFQGDEPYIITRHKGDESISAIFNNIFVVPFALFISIGIFNFLKSKKGGSIAEEEVKKTKTRIKLFVWLGAILPILIVGLLVLFFGEAVISSLRQILP